MELERWLSVIPPKRLYSELRAAQDCVVQEIRGDVITLCAAYRLMCKAVVRWGAIPKLRNLPEKIRRVRSTPKYDKQPLTGSQHAVLRARLESLIRDLAVPRLEYRGDIQNRKARVENYQKQWEDVESVFGEEVDNENMKLGSKARAVWCREEYKVRRSRKGSEMLNEGLFAGLMGDERQMFVDVRHRYRRFESLRDAAKYIAKVTGKRRTRADVRNAISRKRLLADREWGFCDSVAQQVSTGRAKNVRCVTMNNLPFPTQVEAADYAGVSPSCLSHALKGNGEVVSGWQEPCKLKFEYYVPEKKAPVADSSLKIRPLFSPNDRPYSLAA